MKWWLISDEDVKIIRNALEAPTHEANDYNCQDWPPGAGCYGCRGDEERKKGLYYLDTGLHSTNVVPKDFQENVNTCQNGTLHDISCVRCPDSDLCG